MITLLTGDCRQLLPTLDAGSVQCVVTSPPYFGLRDYGVDGQIGLEPLHDCLAWARSEPPCGACYVCTLRAVFAAVWRVLRDDGVVFLNLGDSYASSGVAGRQSDTANLSRHGDNGHNPKMADQVFGRAPTPAGLKPKDLIGIPWRVALALQADGWYLRSDVIWSKPNPMPESVTDRPTRAHEYIFVLTKRERYFYDVDAIREPAAAPPVTIKRSGMRSSDLETYGLTRGTANPSVSHPNGRNARSVWTIPSQAYKGAHFATFPEALVERCILAGTSPQACEACGAPWARVVEGTKYEPPTVKAGIRFVDASRGDKTRKLSGKEYNEQVRRETTGWRATCACPDTTGSAACTVLDPFGGSGTVGKVAIKHNRSAVLIDLSPDYADLQIKRTDGVQRVLF